MKIVSADITGSLIVNGVDVTTTVESSSIWSGSIAQRVTDLEQFSASLDATFATDASVTASILVLSQSVQASELALSGSLSTRVTNLESTSSVLTTASASFAVVSSSYSSASGSLSTRVTTLENASSSFAQDSSSFSIRTTNLESTASVLTTASASFAVVSASYSSASSSLSTRVTNVEITSSAVSSSFLSTSGSISSRVNIIEGQDATTGSNNFTAPQQISDVSNAISFTSTASLYTAGGLRVTKDFYVSGTSYFNNVVVYGTSSIQYITSSQLNIGTNLITVNTDTPTVRFGGLAVYDSGSTGLTGSMLWDSEKNHWVYANPSGSTYSGGMMISGPRSSALGTEVGTTACAVMIGQGTDHITSSGIFSYNNATCFYGTSLISGSGNACFSGQVCSATIVSAGTIQGTTNYASTVVCSPVGCFTTSCASAFVGGTVCGTNGTLSGTLGIGTNTPSNLLELYCNNAASGNYSDILSITAYNSTITNGNGAALVFKARSNAANPFLAARIYTCMTNGGTGTEISSLVFQTINSGTISDKLTITGAGVACFSSTVCSPTFVGGTISGTTGTFSSNVVATGSLIVAPSSNVELQVQSTGVTIGNSVTDSHQITGSLLTSGSVLNFSPLLRVCACTLEPGNTITSYTSLQPSGFDFNTGCSSGNRGIRIYANNTLATSPGGAAIQFFSSDHSAFPGQFYMDSGANNNAALIFRTAVTAGNITERMRITSAGVACFSCQVCAPSFISSTTICSSGNTCFGGMSIINNCLGIGTATPGYKLEVVYNQNSVGAIGVTNSSNGTAAHAGLYIGNDQNSNVGGIVAFGSGYTTSGVYRACGTYIYNNRSGGLSLISECSVGCLYLGTSSAVRMIITPSGCVGIGTTTPESTLHVCAVSSGGYAGSLTLVNYVNATGTSTGIDFGVDASTAGGGNGNAQIKVCNIGAGSGANAADMTFHTWNGAAFGERMRITCNGIVVFSTDICASGNAYFKGTGNYNTVNVDNTSATGGGGVYLRQNGTVIGGIGVSGWYIGDTSNDLFIVSETNRCIRFATSGGTERMRIAAGGNVGICNTNPLARLHIGPETSVGGNTPTIVMSSASGTKPAMLITEYTARSGAFGYDASSFLTLATEASVTSGIRFKVGSSFTSGLLDTGTTAVTITGAGTTCILQGARFGNGSTTLNYYEEGSWTPALQNATVSYSERSGTYVRIGNYVFVRWGFRISSISGQSGTVQISGLPFTAVNWGSYQEPNVSVSTGILVTADYAQRARMYKGGSDTSLYGRIADNGDTSWNTSQLQNGSWIIGEIYYNV